MIEYGDRWGIDSPPDDSYSRTINLDRFEPLHLVADALIDHLVSTYEVTATPVEMDDTNRNCSTLKPSVSRPPWRMRRRCCSVSRTTRRWK
ncbi:DUF6226 family protein [Tsukamurella paurometabola]|uniref:DUF6226 family protein n=1 Tax=Tsukamurella paurometabola TaxID=2061 RepID=UPI000F7E90D2|nr:DUF6226 family protein [Tsukamurella paurometabola]